MKHSIGIMALVGLIGATVGAVAYAEYPRRSNARASSGAAYEDDFNSAIDLTKFRQGNPDWDTQELIASGFKALHQEQEKILKELEEVKASVKKMESRLQ